MKRRDDHLGQAELAAMTDQLDQMHRDQAMPAMRAAVAEWSESLRAEVSAGADGNGADGAGTRAGSRRTFLLGAAGVGAAGLVLAACGSSASPSAGGGGTTGGGGSTSTPSGRLSGDLAVAATAASLENLGIYAYKAGLAAASAGKLGKVPPAVATFAQTAMSQHVDHAKAWNAALVAAGKPAVTATDPALTPTVNKKFAAVTDVTGLAELALLIEIIAAQTYQAAIPLLAAPTWVGVAATIHPVEMQHAAVLYYVLGRYPGIQGTASEAFASGTPLAFSPTDLARPVSDYTGS
jgi:hypothetical protein